MSSRLRAMFEIYLCWQLPVVSCHSTSCYFSRYVMLHLTASNVVFLNTFLTVACMYSCRSTGHKYSILHEIYMKYALLVARNAFISRSSYSWKLKHSWKTLHTTCGSKPHPFLGFRLFLFFLIWLLRAVFRFFFQIPNQVVLCSTCRSGMLLNND